MQTEHITDVPVVDRYVSGGRVILVHCSRDYEQAITDCNHSLAKPKPVVHTYVRRIRAQHPTPHLQNNVNA